MESGYSDYELIERMRMGDSAAFGCLVSRYGSIAHATAFRIVGNSSEADDICQDAFLRVQRRIDTFDTSRPFRPWLLRIVSRVAIDAIDARRHDVSIESIDDHATSYELSSSLNSWIDDDHWSQLIRAWPRLKVSDQQVLVLHHIEGLTPSEIGARLGAREATVRVRIFRAMFRLKEQCENVS